MLVIGFCNGKSLQTELSSLKQLALVSCIQVQPHTDTRRRKIPTQPYKFHLFVYFLTLTKKCVGEPMSCAIKLNPKFCSCLFPKKTSIPFGFTQFIIWNAILLAFPHSAKPKRENRKSRRKEIRSHNDVYVSMFMYFYRSYHTELTDRMCGKNGTLFTSNKSLKSIKVDLKK